MEFIKLLGISKNQNRINYDFRISEGLSRFYSGKPFFIEYPENIEQVPDGVAAVPFVCSVLPLIWIADAILEVPALDKAFYDCIPALKQGYEAMYPETTFAGELRAASIDVCQVPEAGRCAVFFSGGLDSVQTLVQHLEAKPDLFSIWGADVTVDNEAGWEIVSAPIREYAETYGLQAATVRSAFRSFDMEWEMDKVYQDQLQTNWWYGVKHGLALLGHAAPYAYVRGLSTVYIASSDCPEAGVVRCASHPSLDNQVRFVNCRVIHDGFEFDRQAKVHNIVEFARRRGTRIPLHVCWESQTGSNCCECEKCYRTMMGLMAEGEDPVDYGFPETPETLGKMRRILIGEKKLKENIEIEWKSVQRAVVRNREQLRGKYYWQYIKWIMDVDLSHPEQLTLSPAYRLRVWLSQFPLLQRIYQLRKFFKK